MIEYISGLKGREIVIDTDTEYIYIGTLASVAPGHIILEKVDVHERGPNEGTKEKYVHEARKIGVRANRHKVALRMDRIVSVSLLEDVMEF
jgi:hypothetical protein